MIDIIIKYWIQFLCGLVVAGLSYTSKRFWDLYNKEKAHQKSEEQKTMYEDFKKLTSDLYEKSKADDDRLQEEIDGLAEQNENLQKGILSIQGKQFKEDCQSLLEPGHVITVDEFKSIDEDHEAYNALGGNHAGDALFVLVKKKAENDITQ